MTVQEEMTLNPTTANIMYLTAAILGILALVLVFARLNDVKLPLITGDREAFFALAIVGIGMCSLVMGTGGELYGWTDLAVLISIVLGVLLTVLVVAVFFKIQLPFIADDRAAFFALAILILAKFVIANGQRMLDLLGVIY